MYFALLKPAALLQKWWENMNEQGLEHMLDVNPL